MLLAVIILLSSSCNGNISNDDFNTHFDNKRINKIVENKTIHFETTENLEYLNNDSESSNFTISGYYRHNPKYLDLTEINEDVYENNFFEYYLTSGRYKVTICSHDMALHLEIFY